jgi:hypothetical protein
MLELIGKIKIKELKKEKDLGNNRILKSYNAFTTYKSKNTETQFINLYLTIFGDTDSDAWNLITNKYIYGKFRITGLGDKVIFATTDLKDVGFIYYSTGSDAKEEFDNNTMQKVTNDELEKTLYEGLDERLTAEIEDALANF